MILQELDKFVVLLGEVWEVYEKSATHVSLHGLDLFRQGRAVVLHKKVAVFEKTPSTDLFGTLCGYQLLMQMI